MPKVARETVHTLGCVSDEAAAELEAILGGLSGALNDIYGENVPFCLIFGLGNTLRFGCNMSLSDVLDVLREVREQIGRGIN